MARRPLWKDPFTYVIAVGGILVLIGSIMEFVSLTDPYRAVFINPVYHYALAITVPIFSLTAHIVKSRQLASLGMVSAAVAFVNLILWAVQISEYPYDLAGCIICMVGMAVCLVPLCRKPTPQCAHMVTHSIFAVIWVVIGVLLAIADSRDDFITQNICFVLAVWTFAAGLFRIHSLNIALAGAEMMYLTTWVSRFGVPELAIRTVCYYIAFVLSVAHITWLIIDYARNHVSDEMTPKDDGHGEYHVLA